MDTVRKVSNKIAIYYGRKYLMPYFIGLIAIAVNLIPILNGRDLLYEEFITLETMPMIIALKSKDINDILVAGITVTWPVIIDVFFDLLLTQGSVRSYSAFYQISPSATEIFARSCTAVMGFFLIILMLQWAYFMYQNRQEWTNLNDQDIYSLSNFIFVLIFLLFLSITNQSDGGNILKKDTNKIAIQLGFFVVVPAVQYVLHVRADRQLLVTSQQIIDTRAMLIRYISKDVSVPMKKVLHNLKRLADDMNMRTDVGWDELLAVDGMRDTCISAVSALEDLITFDKLENGILDPVMVSMNAWSFLRDIVRPFRSQRSRDGIRFEVTFPPDLILWLEGLCVYVDKGSLCQAFRAVVKNSRNSTPPGGSVCVTARRLNQNEIKTTTSSLSY
eukprot:gene10190-21236_t